MEEWRPVAGYEDYEVSSLGNIRRNGRVRKLNGSPYYIIDLYKDRQPKWFSIHRLVALAFIPNPGNLPFTDHIDGDKKNNAIENLRWTTNQGNQLNPNTPSCPVGKVGHRHISMCGRESKFFQVTIKRMNATVFTKSYKTIEEAIAGRDDFLAFH